MYTNKLCIILFIYVIESYYPSEAYRVFHINGEKTILALENEEINIKCETDVPLTYCGFVHQSGNRYSFSGSTLEEGHCTLKIKATNAEAGEWRCHFGTDVPGVEEIQLIHVRIVGEIAALEQNITVIHEKSVTLFCVTTKEIKPINHCRFETPYGITFGIDSDITVAHPLLGRYYFANNKSLDRGDCAITIIKAQYKEDGIWTCLAILDDNTEHTGVITLEVVDPHTMSNASATGIIFGTITIVAFLSALGFIAWKKRRILGGLPREEPRSSATEQELELRQVAESPEQATLR